VKKMGQLETVSVLTPDGPQNRQVRLGRQYGEDVEVLAGVQAGDQVVMPEPNL
jgi:multidrug efflux pump subunit AcrA (membrane-fusion protein)